MKAQKHFRSLVVLGLTLVGLSTATPRAQADQEGTKPYKAIPIALERDDTYPSGYWTDPFLQSIRGERGPEAVDSLILNEGRDNVGGLFTSVSRQILYFTSPSTADFYIWNESTSANGSQGWSAAIGAVDFATGAVAGTWTSYAENDPTSDVTGSGEFVGANPGDRLNVTKITGWIATVGSKNKKQ